MDKYEYKIRADEINSLIEEGEYADAVAIADTIDWRRVKSVRMLCTVSDLYKINRRYQESKDILLLAYEKHPSGRLIVYSLCELSIKMEEYVQAIEYYKEFVQIAPRDTGRYILQYRLYEAQEVSLEERIAVLEEFKKRDYREKWAYELAYLYHRIGLTTKCVEECDEMYLWFGEGKYVIKAMELKALHTPLSAEQQAKYDAWTLEPEPDMEEETYPPEEEEEDTPDDERYEDEEEEGIPEDTMSMPTADLPQVKTVDIGEYNTLNLQMMLAEGMKEILTTEEPEEEPVERDLEIQGGQIVEMPRRGEAVEEEEEPSEEAPGEEAFQEEGNEEISEEELSIVERIIAPLLQETVKMPRVELSQDTDELQEVVPEATREFRPVREKDLEAVTKQPEIKEAGTEAIAEQPAVKEAKPEAIPEPGQSAARETAREEAPAQTERTIYDSVLSQEYDGQIRLLVPDTDVKAVEKQITGQLSIEDIMAEWEAMKKNNEQKRREDVRQRILEHTGSLFADFDEATKSGLLEQLEKAFVAAIMKESGKSGIKKVILPEDAENVPDSKAVVQPEPSKKQVPVKPEEEEPVFEDGEAGVEEPEEEKEIADEVEEIIEPEETEEPDVEMEDAEEEPESLPPQMFQTVRELTDEERELFGQFIHHRRTRDQLVRTLDNMSMASYTGNVIITGEEDGGALTLAKGLIREMQYSDGNFSGSIAKISGAVLNKKDIDETLSRISNGALIIEKAADMKTATVTKLCRELEKGNTGLLLILEDTKQRINELLSENPNLDPIFDLRVDIEPLDDEALVAYAKQYAEDMEYSIDEFGVLALHTRIADMQTSDHEVTLAEVRELVDEAIYYANRKTPRHFVDILFSKRYDADDMIILRESDFIHY
ncbi:MAG: hypothetical protein NC312_01605 [Bacteroides fragilis]|nr:hypothetical protein [Bacteroides fragilis]